MEKNYPMWQDVLIIEVEYALFLCYFRVRVYFFSKRLHPNVRFYVRNQLFLIEYALNRKK